MYGHVNNARYLEFFEEARWSFIEESIKLKEWEKQGYAFLVVNININYRLPALLDQVVAIKCSVTKIGRKSATIQQKMFIKGTKRVISDADVTFVVIDIKTQKALTIDKKLRSILENFQK
jgi:thioesterase-3